MNDLISRKALLNDFRKTITEQSGTMDWLNMINRQPSMGDNRWIPVSERLPEEYGTYMVAWRPVGYSPEDVMKKTYSGITSFYEMVEYDPDDEALWIGCIEQCDNYSVLAWQPLPEPYKEEQS